MAGVTLDQLDPRPVIRSVVDAYRMMEMPLDRFIQFYLLPATVVSIVLFVAGVVLQLPLYLRGPILLLSVFIEGAVLVYPKTQRDQKRRQIRQRFHLFLTHLTVLSMTNIDRVEVFRTLADTDEYLALAEEMGHIVALVDTWNQSLDDACRMRAKKVPSPLLSDFLERLAYSISAGQQLSDFLVDEQDTMIQNFATRYESDLAKMDVLKELFMSMMMSVAFLMAFMIVLPVLTGMNAMMPIGGVVFVFFVVEGIFLYSIHQASPSDPLWYTNDSRRLARDNRLIVTTIIACVLSFVLLAGLSIGMYLQIPFVLDKIPFPLRIAIPTTPFLIPGWVIRRQENRVRNRDSEFVSFIRALGAVETVKQTSTANVLSTLRRKNFGNLTENINNLYKRLRMRIDTTQAWSLFGEETGSYLINKFADMYVFGRRLGGDPKQLGNVISGNMNEVMKLREKRQQETKTIIGVLYGLTAANVFAFFVSMQVVETLIKITRDMNTGNTIGSMLLHTQSYNVLHVKYLLLMLILLNALFASIMIRITDRGHYMNSLVHFVMLTWVGYGTAVITQHVASSVVSF